MRNCWKVRPSDRPSFTHLRKQFDLILSSQQRCSQYYLQISPQTTNSVSETEILSKRDSKLNMYV